MITITCGDCGFKNKPAKYVIRKLVNFSRRSDLIYKCEKCEASLNIIRDKSQWKMRWIESPDLKIETIRVKDL